MALPAQSHNFPYRMAYGRQARHLFVRGYAVTFEGGLVCARLRLGA